MNRKRPWAQVLSIMVVFGLLCFSGLSAAKPADAQEKELYPKELPEGMLVGMDPASFEEAVFKLPSSQEEPLGLWLNMIRKSYGASISEVAEICIKNADESRLDILTVAKCEMLVKQLTNKQCRVVYVSDKDRLVLDVLNGLKAGKPHTWYGMEKRTGHSDRALLCDLGDGLHSYWFTGDKERSCNNLGFVFLPSPPTSSAVWVCRVVSDSTPVPSEQINLDSFELENDCCCAVRVNSLTIPSGSGTIQHYEPALQCGWE